MFVPIKGEVKPDPTTAEVEKEVAKERQYVIQAALVRVMKARQVRHLSINTLELEAKQLSSLLDNDISAPPPRGDHYTVNTIYAPSTGYQESTWLTDDQGAAYSS